MRPAQSELPSLTDATAAPELLAHLNGEHERQLPQVVALVARTGKGKITVRETLGLRRVFAVWPWRLRDRQDRSRKIPTPVLRALPWAGTGEDPGMPTGEDEKDVNQGEMRL